MCCKRKVMNLIMTVISLVRPAPLHREEGSGSTCMLQLSKSNLNLYKLLLICYILMSMSCKPAQPLLLYAILTQHL